MDYPVAAALAAAVVKEERFRPVGEAAFRQAAEVMERCGTVLCPLSGFGPVNEKNRLLRRMAEDAGKLREWTIVGALENR